ncbi:MAG: carotenoid biosynthesis protein [Oliverpabstia sp.]
MIFGTPVSWFINEMIGSVLFLICIIHALKSNNPINRMLELICYLLTAGIFENIGVWQGIYDYSVNRIMMFGKVPFAILFIEGAIVYFAMLLMEQIHVPAWAIPFGAGVLASVQDMTLDPSSVYDLHSFGGEMEGQWNWTQHYEGGIVGIPFFNFSGWFTMVFFFLIFIQIGRYFYEKKQKTWIGYSYPFAAIICTLICLVTINQFLIFGVPFAKMYSKIPELIMLCINFGTSIIIILKFARYDHPLDMKKDGLMIWMPIFLHGYALVSCIFIGITKAIPTVILVTVIHCMYLCYVYKNIRKNTLSSC